MRMTVLAWLMPMLGVEDLDRSTRFYTQGLGFRVERTDRAAGGRPAFAHLRHGGVDLMMYLLEPGNAGMQDRAARKKMRLHVAVTDPPAWREELRQRGVPALAPEDPFFFEVEDPDGYVLRFGASLGIDDTLGAV